MITVVCVKVVLVQLYVYVEVAPVPTELASGALYVKETPWHTPDTTKLSY